MDVIYGLIPMVLIAGFLVVIAFIWMAKNGHFDDMDGQANRILMDDEFDEDSTESNDSKKTETSQAKNSTEIDTTTDKK